MNTVELLLLGLALAMDAFAVSLSKGVSLRKITFKTAFIIALTFGLFQGLMPVLGFLLGERFEGLMSQFNHWIAFILLALIGLKMLKEAFSEEEDEELESRLDPKELILLGIATSIDAMAVGVSLAFLKVDLATSAFIIFLVTFLLCFIGVNVGNLAGTKYQKKAEILGGIVLILIGLKTLLDHFLG